MLRGILSPFDCHLLGIRAPQERRATGERAHPPSVTISPGASPACRLCCRLPLQTRGFAFPWTRCLSAAGSARVSRPVPACRSILPLQDGSAPGTLGPATSPAAALPHHRPLPIPAWQNYTPRAITSSKLDLLPWSQDTEFGVVGKVLDGAVLLPSDNLVVLGATEHWSGTFATSSKNARSLNLAALLPTRPRSQNFQTGTVSKPMDRAKSVPNMGSLALGAREQGEDVIGHPPHIGGFRQWLKMTPLPVTSSDLDPLPSSQDLVFGAVGKVLDGALTLLSLRTVALGTTEYWPDTSCTSALFRRARNLAGSLAARPRSQNLGTGAAGKPRDRARSLPNMGSLALGTTEQGEDEIGHPRIGSPAPVGTSARDTLSRHHLHAALRRPAGSCGHGTWDAFPRA